MGGPVRRVLRAAGARLLLAMLASMVVALTVTPALCLILLDNAPASSSASRRWCRGCKRHYGALLARVIDAPRAPTRIVARASWWPASACCPFLGAGLLPSFKERDFLMHWVTKPKARRIRKRSASRSAASRELRAIPGVRNFGAHIGRAVGGDEPYGINFTENWISVDPKVDYDKTRASVEDDGRRLSRAVSRRADLPEGTHQGGADRRRRIHRRAHLRPRAAGAARQGGARCEARAEGHPRPGRPARGAAGRSAAGAGQGQPRRRPRATA